MEMVLLEAAVEIALLEAAVEMGVLFFRAGEGRTETVIRSPLREAPPLPGTAASSVRD